MVDSVSNIDVLEILKLGFVGIAFVLAGLSFLLLTNEQRKTTPRVQIIKSIYMFMIFSLLLAAGAIFLQLNDTSNKLTLFRGEYEKKISDLKNKYSSELQNRESINRTKMSKYENKLIQIAELIGSKEMAVLDSAECEESLEVRMTERLRQAIESAKNDGLIEYVPRDYEASGC